MSVIHKKGNGKSKTLMVSFGGCALSFGGIPRFEFMNTLDIHFPDFDRYFLIDKDGKWYHNGIEGISKNIDETLQYLRRISENYDSVFFMGTSAGGYAAILFGSLLNVKTVLVFIPQTLVKFQGMDVRYSNLNSIINTTTRYIVHGDMSVRNINGNHHISHCENIESFENVKVIKNEILNLKKLRDTGELINIIREYI